jgi:hypothetical protein
MSGQWPPEWDDADDGPSDAGLSDGSAVTSFLAEVGSPALPAAFEARISAAIAAEAAARASTSQAGESVAQAAATAPAGAPVAEAGADDAKGRDRSANPEEFSPVAAAGGSATSASRGLRRASRSFRSGAGSGPGGSRPGGRRRRLRMPSPQASGWLVVCCLVIAGFGFLITHAGSSSSSSSADIASGQASAAASSAASAFAGASEPRAASGASGQKHAEQEPSSSAAAGATGVLYINSGTAYQASTLAMQVRGVLNEPIYRGLSPGAPAASSSGSAPASVPNATSLPSASASSSTSSLSGRGFYQPSARLQGCVSKVTDGVMPTLVDKATYDGKPAYIIAVSSQAWVVGPGCTASDTDVIAQVPLKG